MDVAAAWFNLVRMKQSLGRLKPDLLEVFSRLRVNELQTRCERFLAVAFS